MAGPGRGCAARARRKGGSWLTAGRGRGGRLRLPARWGWGYPSFKFWLRCYCAHAGSRVRPWRRSSCASEHPPLLAEPQARPAPSTIRDLSDDLLREILLRLPSLPSLVRAALTCRAFLAAVSSSPAFRRRFRALRPPPLLGFFFGPEGDENPTFTPIRRGSDRDHAAAVRGLDAFLTGVPHQDDVLPGWDILECRGGCLLLFNWGTMQLAVYNPLTGALDLVPEEPKEISEGHRGYFRNGDLFLVVPDDEAPDRRSFRVFSSCYDESRVRVAVFSSAAREWHIHPWSEPVQTPQVGGESWLASNEQVKGFMCWSHDDTAAFLVLLDTATLRFSVIDMPDGCLYRCRTGDTKDGKLCIVTLEEEVLKVTKSSRNQLDQLEVLAIQDGIVYMTPFLMLGVGDAKYCWYLSFCLETRKLENLIYAKARNGIHITPHPYIMPWPASLVGNS